MVFIILEGFTESKKNEVFDDRGPVENMPFLLRSHFRIFLIQMSKYLELTCPRVNWVWFSSF